MATLHVISADQPRPAAPESEASAPALARPLGFVQGRRLPVHSWGAAAPLNEAMGSAYPANRYVILDEESEPAPGQVVCAYLTLRKRGTPEEEAEIVDNGWTDDMVIWDVPAIRRFDRNEEGKIRLSPDAEGFQDWTEGPIGSDHILEITVVGCATPYTALLQEDGIVYFTQGGANSHGVSLQAATENAKLFEASSWDGLFIYHGNSPIPKPAPETHFGLEVLEKKMWGRASADVTARTVAIHVQASLKEDDVVLAMDAEDRLQLLRFKAEGFTTMKHGPVAGSVTPIGVVWSHADSYVRKAA